MGTPIECVMMGNNTFITGFARKRITRFETDCATSKSPKLDWLAAGQNSNLLSAGKISVTRCVHEHLTTLWRMSTKSKLYCPPHYYSPQRQRHHTFIMGKRVAKPTNKSQPVKARLVRVRSNARPVMNSITAIKLITYMMLRASLPSDQFKSTVSGSRNGLFAGRDTVTRTTPGNQSRTWPVLKTISPNFGMRSKN